MSTSQVYRSTEHPLPLLCAVTLDSHGASCLRYARQRATTTGQPITVVHIAHQTMRTAGTHQRRSRSPRLLLPIVDIARDLLDEFIQDFEEQAANVDPGAESIAMTRIVEPGIPGTRIPDLAERIGATAIIVGGTRRGGWQRLLRGSIAADVLHHASVPVFVVDAAGRPIDARDILPESTESHGIRAWLAHLIEGRRRATL